MSESIRDIVDEVQQSRTTADLSYDEKITLTWIDVGLTIKEPKPKWFTRLFHPKRMKTWKEDEGQQLLYGIIGKVQPGEIVGIMGESGSGKSLFLKTLAGRITYGEPNGMIQVNGLDRQPNGWNRFVCFLDDEDVLDCELTVLEMITFATRIKLPDSKYIRKEKDQIAIKLIDALQLTERKDTKIKALSAGELRRVSIAVELAAERHLLLLDEPTSGLDSKLALDLVRLIRNITHLFNLSVVIAVHQPREKILGLLDRLLLLSRGTTVYFGTLGDAVQHFEQVTGVKRVTGENPGDYLMDCISMNRLDRESRSRSEEKISKLQLAWKSIEALSISSGSRSSRRESMLRRRQSVTSRFFNATDTTPIHEWPVSRWSEFCLLLQRYFREEFRDWRVCLVYVLVFIVLGLFYGFLYFQLTTENFGGFQSRLGLMSQMSSVQFALVAGQLVTIFIRSRPVVIRERSSATYRPEHAYLAKLLALFPLRLFSVLLFGTIVYYLAGLRTDSFVYYLIFIGFLLLIDLNMVLLGSAVSAIGDSIGQAILYTVFLGIGFFIFSGISVRIPDITPILSWLRFLSPYYFATTGLIQNEVLGLTIAGRPGEFFLQEFAVDEISIMWGVGGLLITAIAYFFIGIVAFILKTQPKYIVI